MEYNWHGGQMERADDGRSTDQIYILWCHATLTFSPQSPDAGSIQPAGVQAAIIRQLDAAMIAAIRLTTVHPPETRDRNVCLSVCTFYLP